MPVRPRMTQAYLKSLVKYNSKTGTFMWRVDHGRYIAGEAIDTINGAGYVQGCIDGKAYLMHRLAFLYKTGIMPKRLVDHKNGIRHDNRWTNLRECTYRQNRLNSSISSNNTSGVKGVSYESRKGKWLARGKQNNRSIFIGYFDTLEEAAEARQTFEKQHHGKFIRSTATPERKSL